MHSRRPNHWISTWGPMDRCAGCGEEVPNASGRPIQVTGHCTAIDLVPKDLCIICLPCLRRPPYFGVEDPGWGHLKFLHPGWCMLCREFMGDAFAIVQRTPPVVDLVRSLLGPLAG